MLDGSVTLDILMAQKGFTEKDRVGNLSSQEDLRNKVEGGRESGRCVQCLGVWPPGVVVASHKSAKGGRVRGPVYTRGEVQT